MQILHVNLKALVTLSAFLPVQFPSMLQADDVAASLHAMFC